jgi:RNA polymerase sigma factor (sigma-70 family)
MPALRSTDSVLMETFRAQKPAQIEWIMPETQVSEFERLMTDVAAGSEEAVWKLAETYTPYILRVLRPNLTPQVRRRIDSQDLAQILWASILLRRSELTRLKTPDQLIAYLCRAAKNRVIDARRRFLETEKYDMDREESLEPYTRDESRRPAEIPTGNRAYFSRDLSPSQFASVRERWNHILKQSSERDRIILKMRLQGCSYDAISEHLQINLTTVRRAIERLIARFSE